MDDGYRGLHVAGDAAPLARVEHVELAGRTGLRTVRMAGGRA